MSQELLDCDYAFSSSFIERKKKDRECLGKFHPNLLLTISGNKSNSNFVFRGLGSQNELHFWFRPRSRKIRY